MTGGWWMVDGMGSRFKVEKTITSFRRIRIIPYVIDNKLYIHDDIVIIFVVMFMIVCCDHVYDSTTSLFVLPV